MSKTAKLRFERGYTTDWLVPARGKRRFSLQPNTSINVSRVELLPKYPHKLTLFMPDASNLDTLMSECPLNSDGTLKKKFVANPATCVTAIVENLSDEPFEAYVVLTGSDPEFDATYVFAMGAVGTRDHRFPLPSGQSISMTMQPPVDCRVVRITARSAPGTGLFVDSLRWSNVNAFLGLAVPLEYFGGDGAEVRSCHLSSANRITIDVRNDSSVDSWVEVDLEVEPTSDEERRKNAERAAEYAAACGKLGQHLSYTDGEEFVVTDGCLQKKVSSS
jgi:hypothetical protein